MNQMEKDILKVLFENKGKRPMSSGVIHIDLAHHYNAIVKVPEVETALRDLKELKLIRSQRKPAIKAKEFGQWSMPALEVFEITTPGIHCVENDFVIQPMDHSYSSGSPIHMNNGQLVFGSHMNVENNVIHLINDLNIEMNAKNEVMNLFNLIRQEMKNDQISKSKLKDHLNKIAEKGSTKLAEAVIGVIIKELIQ